MSVGGGVLRHHGVNAFTDQQSHEITQHGFLNRKTIHDPNTRKKDRSWQTFWFSLKGSTLGFYRVDNVRAKSQGEPPPRDILPPPKQSMVKVGFVEIEGAVVEVDYTSQENMDIQKRRKHLFRVELQNRTQLMFQAPSDDKRKAWVLALQAASRRKSLGGEEDSLLLGHSIKTSRCSIKQRSAHNVHVTASQSFNASASLDDPDYVDFSLAERMVSRDPRLRALKKRLQAKKQLLSQLNKMYTSFLGGNVAALYDDTLLLQQHEPPTINGKQVTTKENGEKKVVHRRMSLPDSEANGHDGEDTIGTRLDDVDRRASTGDFNVPIVTPVSPGVDSIIEGLETELLIDYHLVPGADWSLLKKGTVVKVLGKTRTDGRWYRCMVHRDVDVKIPDLSLPPPAVVNALLPGTIISQGNGMTGQSSQLQREVVTEESLNDIAMEEENDKLLSSEAAATEETDAGAETTEDLERKKDEEEAGNEDKAAAIKEEPKKEREPDKDDVTIHDTTSQDKGDSEDLATRRSRNSDSTGTAERPLSYLLATGEDTLKDGKEVPQQTKEREKSPPVVVMETKRDTRPKRKVGKLSRSTSSPSTGARIRLQETMGLRSVPGIAQSPILQSRFSVSTSRSGLSASFPPVQGGEENEGPSRMAKLLESEANTGSYSCPLVGCIPGSALKHFAEKEDNKRFSMSPVSSTSPSLVYTQSATSLNSLSETPTQLDVPVFQQNGTTEEHVPKDLSTTPGSLDNDIGSEAATPNDDGGEVGEVSSRISITVTGDEDNDEIELSPEAARRARNRAHSLPPQLLYSPSPSPSPDNNCGDDRDTDSSSLDRSPSHLRRSPGFKSPEPTELTYSQMHSQTSQSVQSTPMHKLRPSSPKGQIEGSKQLGSSSNSISSLFESSSTKKSIFKKLFGKKPATKQRSMTDVDRSGARSPSPNFSPSLLKSVLLGKEVEDDFPPQDRARVSSISGRPVRRDGVGIVIGNESSSESEDEGDDTFQEVSSPTVKEAVETELAVKKLGASRNLSGDLRTSSGLSPTSPVRIPRSTSEHGSALRMKGATSPELPEAKEMSESKETAKAKASSLKRPTKIRMASFKKTKIKGKKRPSSEAYVTESESGTPMSDVTTPKLTGIFRHPPRGEQRMVYLDPLEEKYGFRLQSYGRVREQGKVLQTFVQNVVPGSVSFMAGLYPGDAIVAINGENVKYAPINEIYKSIKNASKGKERIALEVVFADGVTRLECMKKSDEVKNTMKEKQQKLRELLATERLHSTPPTTPLPSPQHITLVEDLPSWSETTPINEPGRRPFPYDRHLNQVVSLHGGSITSLACDKSTLVMPLSSCFRQESETENVLFQLLRNGGEELLDELSLARQGRVGDIIVTKGHNLKIRNIYHCVFGDLEESLQSCCRKALETACEKGLPNIVFWVDGFASLSVSPHLILEAVRQWLHEGTNGSKFERVVFSAKANLSLMERHMDDYFPLQPFVFHDRTVSELSESNLPQERTENVVSEPDKATMGTENETSESAKQQNGTENEAEESEVVEKKSESQDNVHKKALASLHERDSVVSIDGIGIDLGDENVNRIEEPIPEDVEPESDTVNAANGPVSMENIELELQGVDSEMDNIQSILLEMQHEQSEKARQEEERQMEEEEDPLGLLRFLDNKTEAKGMQTSASLSAHTSPTHFGVNGLESKLSSSLPFLDIEVAMNSPPRLNAKREESDV